MKDKRNETLQKAYEEDNFKKFESRKAIRDYTWDCFSKENVKEISKFADSVELDPTKKSEFMQVKKVIYESKKNSSTDLQNLKKGVGLNA